MKPATETNIDRNDLPKGFGEQIKASFLDKYSAHTLFGVVALIGIESIAASITHGDISTLLRFGAFCTGLVDIPVFFNFYKNPLRSHRIEESIKESTSVSDNLSNGFYNAAQTFNELLIEPELRSDFYVAQSTYLNASIAEKLLLERVKRSYERMANKSKRKRTIKNVFQLGGEIAVLKLRRMKYDFSLAPYFDKNGITKERLDSLASRLAPIANKFVMVYQIPLNDNAGIAEEDYMDFDLATPRDAKRANRSKYDPEIAEKLKEWATLNDLDSRGQEKSYGIEKAKAEVAEILRDFWAQ